MEFELWKKGVIRVLVPECEFVRTTIEKNELEILYNKKRNFIYYSNELQKIIENELEDEQWELSFHYINKVEDCWIKTTHIALKNKTTKREIYVYSRLNHSKKIEFRSVSLERKITAEEKAKMKNMLEFAQNFEENHGPNRLLITTGLIGLE